MFDALLTENEIGEFIRNSPVRMWWQVVAKAQHLATLKRMREWSDEDCGCVAPDDSKHLSMSHGKIQRKNCRWCWEALKSMEE